MADIQKGGTVFYPHGSMKIETLRGPGTEMDDETLFDVWSETMRLNFASEEGQQIAREVESALRRAMLARLSMYGQCEVTSNAATPPISWKPG